jgi:hypothetical protein
MTSSMQMDKLTEPEWIFPFQGMSVGDSFFIPTLRFAEMIYAIDSGSKRIKVKTKTFVTAKDGHLGVRTWRVG